MKIWNTDFLVILYEIRLDGVLMIQLQTYTLKAMLKQTVERHGNRPALTMVDAEPITYQQLDGLIGDDVIDLMRDHGIKGRPGSDLVPKHAQLGRSLSGDHFHGRHCGSHPGGFSP